MTRNPQKKSANRAGVILLLAIALLAAVLVMNRATIKRWLGPGRSTAPQTATKQQEPLPDSASLPSPPTPQTTPGPPGPDQVNPLAAPATDACRQITEQLLAYYDQLDQQNYVADYQFSRGSRRHFNEIIHKLLANPPIVAGETDDLFSILKNMAHFYRVLGSRDIQLIKDILAEEGDRIEPTLALYYRWYQLGPQCRRQAGKNLAPAPDLPLAGLYGYAGYFLNTVGGQSYLFRRDPRVRMLVRYYAILIVDQANTEKNNRYGIDLRYPIKSLIEEMASTRLLTGQEAYLQRLEKLQAKYLASAGPLPR